ncbi:hypothetical protein MMC26_007046 [Xylographa opegraphella]|nr:hypothetical protein [Xylographa opegraphella]
MSTASSISSISSINSSISAWPTSPANSSSSSTDTWSVAVEEPAPRTRKDLPPPWWSPDQACSKCRNCGGPVYSAVRYLAFPGVCSWCHTGLVHLFRRHARPSPWTFPDRAEREWRADLLRFNKAVVEKRRANGYQDRIGAPDVGMGRKSVVEARVVDKGARMRVDPQRVQELRNMATWRPVEPVVQPVLSQSIEAMERDVKSLTVAQLKRIFEGEGLPVSCGKAQMQDRFVSRKPGSVSLLSCQGGRS